jgi:hypothetical protein
MCKDSLKVALAWAGWKITLVTTPQPPNSPYLNVNDSSFFCALQACQRDSVEEARDNVDLVIEAVADAYHLFCPRKLNLFKYASTCRPLLVAIS